MEKQEFLYYLSLLHDKILQVQSLIQLLQCSPQAPTQQGPIASKIGSIMQEVVMAASSMVIMCHSIDMGSSIPPKTTHPTASAPWGHDHDANHHDSHHDDHEWVMMDENAHIDAHPHGLSLDTLSDSIPQSSQGDDGSLRLKGHQVGPLDTTTPSGEIIELSPAEILAEFTHYCHLCFKGFKRGANLRMHMRAHGEEYKTSAALVRPKGNASGLGEGQTQDQDPLVGVARKYSCPHEGCRWNRNHAKFLPLKSMVCVRNHYKRSHCPKVYICKRCNTKRFSLLADLRTHEKHCGDVKWQCSCGTSFSRKDKLLGHVALFKGHTPFVRCSSLGRKA